MEKITFTAPDTNEQVELFILEETTINQQKYLLVAEEEEGDSEAYIMKKVAEDDSDDTYEMVEDETEFNAIAKVFEELLEDTDFEM